jgi:inhibitor of Bruton tyrosine kinase
VPGNSILLLQRPDIDTSLKDYEGYTAFDLYNSTVEGTKPTTSPDGLYDLFTWGANR